MTNTVDQVIKATRFNQLVWNERPQHDGEPASLSAAALVTDREGRQRNVPVVLERHAQPGPKGPEVTYQMRIGEEVVGDSYRPLRAFATYMFGDLR